MPKSNIKNLIKITDLSRDEIDHLIEIADQIEANPRGFNEMCRHKKLATLFFEPSTRTRLSFTAAMMMAGCYADIIAMRHPKEGAPVIAAQKTTVPLINAGDGGHFHPTQTLTDLLTISRKKQLGNFTIGLCGDLMFGRTVHSLIEALLRYEGIRFILISPPELRLPKYVKDEMDAAGAEWSECEKLEDAMPDLDILYMTRVQRERFFNEEDYVRLRDSYILTLDKLKTAKDDMIIMHPLPRVNEIAVEVDDDPRACYFYQALCGKHIRMALILYLLGLK